MKKFVRYAVVPAGIFIFLLIVTATIIPILINVPKYVPEIEKRVSQATGRSFSLGPDLGLSFFPWLSITFSDMQMGNPPRFQGDAFLKIRTCEVRIKILPLLLRHIEISRFVVGGLSLNLEKNDGGQGNWGFGKAVENGNDETQESWPLGLLAEKMSFALVAVTDGQVLYNDRVGNVHYQAEDLSLLLKDFTPDSRVSVDGKATVNGKAVAVEGTVGPVVDGNGQTVLPLDLAFGVVHALQGKMQGKITLQDNTPNYELSFNFSPFSPYEFFSACALPFPLQWKDYETFKVVDLGFSARGDQEKIAIDQGAALFDDSKLNFSLKAQNLRRPQIDFALGLDRIDVDRYLPPAVKDGITAAADGAQEDGIDDIRRYLEDITFDGVMHIGALKIHGGTMTDLAFPLKGKERVFTAAPATFTTCQGKVETALTLDLRATEPTMQVNLKAQGLEAQDLFHDYFGWDVLCGTLSADLALWFGGSTTAAMKKNLSGEAGFTVQNGALLGVDLAKKAGTSDSQSSAAATGTPMEKPRTEFNEGKGLVTINNGLLHIRATSLITSPYNLNLSGTADIVRESLNLKLEAGGVTTVVGKGGRQVRMEQPSLYDIRGTFSEPELLNRSASPIDGKADTKIGRNLLAQSVGPPLEDELKDLVGKDLVDPAVVAQRFGLSVETLRCTEVKKRLTLGTGRIRIGALREEPARP